MVDAVRQVNQLTYAYGNHREEADEKHYRTEESEHVHRLLAEAAEEPQRDKVEIAVYETVEAELRLAVFARLMMHNLFADAVEARVFRKIRDVSVHLSIHLDILYHILAISLQSAVEVVQVMYSADFPCRRVENLCRNGFRQWVVALLFISGYKVKLVLGNHAVKFRNLVGRVLQVGIHRDNHIALCLLETAIQRGTLAIVAAELYTFHVLVLFAEAFYHLPRTVGRAVVYEYHFKRELVSVHHPLYPSVKFGQRLLLII